MSLSKTQYYTSPNVAVQNAEYDYGFVEYFEGIDECLEFGDECEGWDGGCNRCDCGNQNVRWEAKQSEYGWYAIAKSY